MIDAAMTHRWLRRLHPNNSVSKHTLKESKKWKISGQKKGITKPR
jgi:hypothetical protein